MVEVLGTGDNGFENNAIQEARSLLGTIVAALATIGNELYLWFQRIANWFLNLLTTRPDYALMLITNLIILFS